MSTCEGDSDHRKFLQVFDLPSNILQTICQLLLDEVALRIYLFGYYRYDYSRSGLRDIINLRSICVHFNDAINDMVLFLPCYSRCYSEFLLPDFVYFLGFIRKETRWRFEYLQITSDHPSESREILEVLDQNEALFATSLKRVVLDVYQMNNSMEDASALNLARASIDKIIQWVKKVSLKLDLQIEIWFNCNISVVSDPSVISKLGYHGSFDEQILSYYYVTELVLFESTLNVNNLKAFPNLTSLSVGNLTMEISPQFEDLPIFPKITFICVHFYDPDLNWDNLPGIVGQCFPCLQFFQFSDCLGNISVDFAGLPDSCRVVKTHAHLLRCFVYCKHIRCLILNDFSPPDADPIFYETEHNFHLDQLSCMVLKLYNRDTQILLDILSKASSLTSLEVLSVYFDGNRCFRDDNDFGTIDFLRQLDELEKLYNSFNFQMIVFGNIALMKKSASSILFSRLDKLQSKYWAVRSLNTTVSSLD